MAIDFMIMPLSRYIQGDFVTPNMRMSWELGIPYSIVSPDGNKECPKDVPFGGPNAPTARLKSAALMVEKDFTTYPYGIGSHSWDELSNEEPCFHRVDPRSYGALLALVAAPTVPAGGWLRWLRPASARRAKRSHVGASLFLPCEFPEMFIMQTPFVDREVGSAFAARDELERHTWTEAAKPATETLREALEDSIRLRLPMIVDS